MMQRGRSTFGARSIGFNQCGINENYNRGDGGRGYSHPGGSSFGRGDNVGVFNAGSSLFGRGGGAAGSNRTFDASNANEDGRRGGGGFFNNANNNTGGTGASFGRGGGSVGGGNSASGNFGRGSGSTGKDDENFDDFRADANFCRNDISGSNFGRGSTAPFSGANGTGIGIGNGNFSRAGSNNNRGNYNDNNSDFGPNGGSMMVCGSGLTGGGGTGFGRTGGLGSNFGRGGSYSFSCDNATGLRTGNGNFSRAGDNYDDKNSGFGSNGNSTMIRGSGLTRGGGTAFGRNGRLGSNFGRGDSSSFSDVNATGFETGGGNFNCAASKNNRGHYDDNNSDFGRDDYKDNGPSHVPKKRDIEEIFGEDAHSAENYMQIREDDENIVVTGLELETVSVVEKWEEANFEESLMANIARAKYSVPRKIQSYAIPLIMDGFDVKGHAETGSGKTAAFLIPIINTIIKKKAAGEFKSRRSHPFGLIVEPTRELATQLYDQTRKLAYETGVSVAVTYGKYRKADNLREISIGCDILVGTPGRLKDFICNDYVLVENLKYVVLDEADRLLTDEFMRDLRKISRAFNFPEKEKRQTLLFSATFSPEVQQWADEWLREQNVMISNQKFASANSKVIQHFVMLMSNTEKQDYLFKMLKDELEEAKKNTPEGEEPCLRRTLVFVQKKRDADILSSYLCQENIKATSINGNRTQQLREESLEKFRKNEVQLVVSTDVCARGIDIKDLDHVINYDLPMDYVTYVHRIGRTGRLKEGMATSFFDPDADQHLAEALVKGAREANQEPPQFLVEASENRLVIPSSKEDDDAWGFSSATKTLNNLGLGGTSTSAFGGSKKEFSNQMPASTAENDEW